MTYELLLTPQAEADVDNIIRYLAIRSPQGALAWCERWEQVMTELARDPLGLAPAQESARYKTDVRQLLFKTRRGRTYRALCTVVGAGIYILHVRGPGQNLLERKGLRRH